MRNSVKYVILYCCAVGLLITMVVQLASAQDLSVSHPPASEPQVVEFDQQQLDQILAPIALYPDSLLSHILIASTYPIEVIQAARWRDEHQSLDQQGVMDEVEDKPWDPSVKALAPFHELLQTLSEDLDWLEDLGNAFLADEAAVLAAVQGLRQKAYELGNLRDNDYIQVEEDEGEIVIQPVEKTVVYVPYYDTRVVYGPWWHSYPPYYWQRPSHYVWHSGFYWSHSIFISPAFYFGGFHWHNRHTLVDYRWRNAYGQHRYHSPEKVVRNHEYQRWQHNPQHRRGARYVNDHYSHNKMRPLKVVSNQEVRRSKSGSVSVSRSGQASQVVRNTTKVYGANKHDRQDSGELRQKLREQQEKPPVNKAVTHNKMRVVDAPASHNKSSYKGEDHVRERHVIERQKKAPLATAPANNSQYAKPANTMPAKQGVEKVQRYQPSESSSRQSAPKAVEYKARENRGSARSTSQQQGSSARSSHSAKHKER